MSEAGIQAQSRNLLECPCGCSADGFCSAGSNPGTGIEAGAAISTSGSARASVPRLTIPCAGP